tara:strand:- start:33 stop:347 length:315 start_codon:yes stop_codon:yes gene_type:complete
MRSKKGATSLGVLILVLMALVLTGATLLGFLFSDAAQEIISDVRFIERVYVDEEKINFLINQSVEKEEAVSLIGGKLLGEEVEISKKVETDDNKIEIIYRFKIK